MTKQELANTLHISISTIETNFPKLCVTQLEKGILITKTGVGKNAEFFIEETTPRKVNKSYFSTSPKTKQVQDNLNGEKWITTYLFDDYEVSNLGRIRNKKTKYILQGTSKDGYVRVYLHDSSYQVHRIVLQSWNPNVNYQALTVDHINGIRSDNRLENLRWGTSEENTMWLLRNRKDITIETTRLINKYGYDKTLALLKSLD